MENQKIKPYKLLIGIPSRGEFKTDFALNLCFLIHLISVNPVQVINEEPRMILWNIHCARSSSIQGNRQKIVDMACRGQVDALLFLDDDMIFDPEFIFEWIKDERQVLAMNCPTRSIPCHPTARIYDPAEPFKGKVVYSDVANERWERVWRVGTGIMLIKGEVLQKLPRPAFTPRWEPGNDDYVGEDWVFCENINDLGVPIYIDNKYSLSVEHVGDVNYTHEMAAGTRRAIANRKGQKDFAPGTIITP